MKMQYIAPETEVLQANTGMLLQVSSEGIPYGGVDEEGEKEPAVKGLFEDTVF